MSLLGQLARVRAARADMDLARHEFSEPASALLARGQQYPLTTVGTAAGAGFVLGTLNVHPLRVPGLSSLLGGGLAEVIAHSTRLISELGAFDFGGSGKGKDADAADGQEGDSSQSS